MFPLLCGFGTCPWLSTADLPSQGASKITGVNQTQFKHHVLNKAHSILDSVSAESYPTDTKIHSFALQ